MIKSVLITGASKGIGRACALHMQHQGWRVFAGVRKQADANDLDRESSGAIRPVFMDVTVLPMIDDAVKTIMEETGDAGIQGLVNNAGVAWFGPLEFLPLEDYRMQFEINVLGQIAVTQGFLPLIRKGRGRIVNMASMSGRFASPLLSPYAASKFALEAVSDALRRELVPWRIHVAVIEPGKIATPIWEKTRAQGEALRARLPDLALELYGPMLMKADELSSQNDDRGLAPQRVAKAVAHALIARRPRTRYPVGLDSWGIHLATRLLSDKTLDWFTRLRLAI